MQQVHQVPSLPPCVNLKVPHFSQLDNKINPTGSCNVTSVAMVLSFLGIKGNGNGQLEDQLYQRMEGLGLSRHSPQDLAAFINSEYGKYGIKDTFNPRATRQQIKQHLAKGNPVFVHGYFTDFGHILVVRGYDDGAYTGRGAFIVNDPYGEYYESGYDTKVSGENQYYSYALFDKLVAPDGGMWAHFMTRSKKETK